METMAYSWAAGPRGARTSFPFLVPLPHPHHFLRPLERLGGRKDLRPKTSRMILISPAPDSRPQHAGMVVRSPPCLQLLWGLKIISGH